MEENINKNKIYIGGHIFSVESILVISIFIVGVIIIIIGLIIDSKKPHIEKSVQLPIYNIQQSNIQQQQTISNNTKSVLKTIQIEEPKKNILTKIDSNYSTDSGHVYFGQSEGGSTYPLELNKDKIKIAGDYITDGINLYYKDKKISISDSNIDLNNIQNAGQTYLRDKKNVYATVTLGRSGGNKLEKVDININQMQFFLDGQWEYIKDNNKIYYSRGELYVITTLHGKIDKNGIKQWSIEGDTYRIKGQLSPMKIIDKNLIDFIKNTSSVYIKEIKKIDENYSTDGKKLYYINKNNMDKEIQLGNSDIDINNISILGKYYIKDKNYIYSISQIGITKLDLDINNIQILSGQYEYINYDKNKKNVYYECIKDNNKAYYMRDTYASWVISSIDEQIVTLATITSMSGEQYNKSDKKWKLNLLDATNNKISSAESFTNKTIIEFVSNVNGIKKI